MTLIQHNIELDVCSNGWQVYIKHYLPLEIALGLQNYTVVRALLVAGCSLHNSTASADCRGPVSWSELHTEAFDYIRVDTQQLLWLTTFVQNAASLRLLCQRTIRRLLGTPFHIKLNKLDSLLPKVLINSLAMEDIKLSIKSDI